MGEITFPLEKVFYDSFETCDILVESYKVKQSTENRSIN